MRKLAILTLHRTNNYGAVLQAYALRQTIVSFGVEAEILDLLRPNHPGYRKTKRNAALIQSASGLPPKNTFLGQIKTHGLKWMNLTLGRRRRQRFNEFRQTCFKYSQTQFSCSDDLYQTQLDYDGFVTGSDQVWNPTYPYNTEPYFLTFAPSGIPRIAYAPSFGVSDLHTEVHGRYRAWINGITHLSVRERHGASLIQKLTGRAAEVVLDPTFLLTADDWRLVAREPNAKTPYIFCYALAEVPGLMHLCHHLKRITGHRIYKLGNAADILDIHSKAVIDAGPREFLGWIMNSAIVVTNSFHGAILAINMGKPFYVVPSPVQGMNSKNSRLESVMEIFGLQHRLWSLANPLPLKPDLSLDYSSVNERLAVERNKSLSFLRHAVVGESRNSTCDLCAQ